MRVIRVIVIVAVVAALGCGRGESMAKKAGSKVGETLTDFASGVGAGIDKKMIVEVELSKGLAEAGITKTVSKAGGMARGNGKDLAVYLMSQKPFKATLLATALNKEGQEIGRSTADVDFAASDAKYVTFSFPEEMDTQLVAKYTVDARK